MIAAICAAAAFVTGEVMLWVAPMTKTFTVEGHLGVQFGVLLVLAWLVGMWEWL